MQDRAQKGQRCGDVNVTAREKSGSAGGDEEWWPWEKAQVSHTQFQMLAVSPDWRNGEAPT